MCLLQPSCMGLCGARSGLFQPGGFFRSMLLLSPLPLPSPTAPFRGFSGMQDSRKAHRCSLVSHLGQALCWVLGEVVDVAGM